MSPQGSPLAAAHLGLGLGLGLGSVGCDGEVAGLSSSQNGEGNGADELVVETLHSFLDTLNRAKDSIGR